MEYRVNPHEYKSFFYRRVGGGVNLLRIRDKLLAKIPYLIFSSTCLINLIIHEHSFNMFMACITQVKYVCLFDLIMSQSTIFQSCQHGSSWVEPVLSRG